MFCQLVHPCQLTHEPWATIRAFIGFAWSNNDKKRSCETYEEEMRVFFTQFAQYPRKLKSDIVKYVLCSHNIA